MPALAATIPAEPQPGSWSIDLGVAALHAPVYAGSRHVGTDVFPQFGFTYGTRLQGSIDDGVRWSAVKTGIFQAGPVAEYRQSDRFHQTLPTRGNHDAIELGGFAQLNTPVADIEARVRKAVNGYAGWSGDLSADAGLDLGRWTIGGEARLAYADQRFVYNLYGSGAHRPPRAGIRAMPPSYLTAGAEGDVGYAITKRLMLGGLVAYDRFISTFDAASRRRRGITQFGTALTFHFGTAPRR